MSGDTLLTGAGKYGKRRSGRVNIHAWHPKWRRLLYIEVKGGSGKHKHPEIHNAFPAVLGQIVSRMDKEGNHPKRARIYAIGIPESWAAIFKRKIQKMKYGWRLLKLRVFVVGANGEVSEKPYSHMLRQ